MRNLIAILTLAIVLQSCEVTSLAVADPDQDYGHPYWHHWPNYPQPYYLYQPNNFYYWPKTIYYDRPKLRHDPNIRPRPNGRHVRPQALPNQRRPKP